jgi:hypothetical protein
MQGMQLNPNALTQPCRKRPTLRRISLAAWPSCCVRPYFREVAHPLTYTLLSFHQLLENERHLLVLADRDKHSIYLERLSRSGRGHTACKAIKLLRRDHVGEDLVIRV